MATERKMMDDLRYDENVLDEVYEALNEISYAVNAAIDEGGARKWWNATRLFGREEDAGAAFVQYISGSELNQMDMTLARYEDWRDGVMDVIEQTGTLSGWNAGRLQSLARYCDKCISMIPKWRDRLNRCVSTADAMYKRASGAVARFSGRPAYKGIRGSRNLADAIKSFMDAMLELKEDLSGFDYLEDLGQDGFFAETLEALSKKASEAADKADVMQEEEKRMDGKGVKVLTDKQVIDIINELGDALNYYLNFNGGVLPSRLLNLYKMNRIGFGFDVSSAGIPSKKAWTEYLKSIFDNDGKLKSILGVSDEMKNEYWDGKLRRYLADHDIVNDAVGIIDQNLHPFMGKIETWSEQEYKAVKPITIASIRQDLMKIVKDKLDRLANSR